MIEAIFVAGEAYYPDYDTKAIKTDVTLKVPVYNIDTVQPNGWYSSIPAGSNKIQRHKIVNGKTFLYISGYWVKLSDVSQYLVNGGVIRALCSTVYKALHHFQSLEVV